MKDDLYGHRSVMSRTMLRTAEVLERELVPAKWTWDSSGRILLRLYQLQAHASKIQ